MKPLLYNLGIDAALGCNLAELLDADIGTLKTRQFPDGETYLRFDDDCQQRSVILACSLDQPNDKVVPLLLAADTLRDLGAGQVGLVAPYLAYMRQDMRFHPGEGITARYFARLLSAHFDWLATVDPHLHRFHAMDEIYRTPAIAVHAAPVLAEWIGRNVSDPLLIGPDEESRQWVADVAARAGAPFLVLEKQRFGDRDVRVSLPELGQHGQRVPVILDDIVSSGRTAVATIEHLLAQGSPAPVCAFVHGVFADGALSALRAAGASRIVTCNTIIHETNAIDVSTLLASASRSLMAEPSR